MPRLSADIAAKPVNRATAARPRATRAKKPAVPQDRLTARTLFFRRVRRSLKPGLWGFGVVAVLIVLTELFRALPSVTPVTVPTGGLRHGVAALAGYAGFRVKKIEIDGAVSTPVPAIQAALGIAPGDPIFSLSLPVLQARLQQLGAVQSVAIQRQLPGTLIVTIKERSALAIWQNNAAGAPATFVLIDHDGKVIADQDAAAAKRHDPSLLLLVGDDAPQTADTLLNELRAAPPVLARVVAAERVDGLRWNLTLKDQAVVKLPADNEAQAVTQLAGLQAQMQLLDRPVEVIDLRLPGRLVVRPYPGPPAASPATPKDTHKEPTR